MGRAAILVTWPGFEADGRETGARLQAAGHAVRIAPEGVCGSPGALIELLDGVAGAIVSTDPFDARVLEAATSLRVIARVGVGTDSIDLDAAARHGVAVCTTPGANTATSADHTLALMLAALRRVAEHDRAVRAGAWDRTGPALGWELGGATVGLIGYGAIGREVHRRLAGFGARVLVYDPYLQEAPGVERVALDSLLRSSDVVSLHAPLTGETRRLLDRARLALLPSHAVVVNTARGGLIDEAALADALEAGALRAAALDVLAREPPDESRLVALPNVVFSPHVAGLSERSVREMTRRATDAVLAVLSGHEPPGLVTPPSQGVIVTP